MRSIVQEKYNFPAVLQEHNLQVSPKGIETLFINITKMCNQVCIHCHVDASPTRQERMARPTIDQCLGVLAHHDEIINVDITGGAPELHIDFAYFVSSVRKLNKHVIVRHNLTIITDGNPQTGENMEYLPEFFADQSVEIIASLPYYTEKYTNRQRGQGVFQKSLNSLRQLNNIGYGREGTGLILNLVHNASGPISPNDRSKLEADYKEHLKSRYDISFNQLYTVTNMPINRFYNELVNSGTYDDYMTQLVGSFNPLAVSELVCRSLVSVGYDGRLYDCDFNQILELQIPEKEPMTIFTFDYNRLLHRNIRFASHCFGCTAGGGSN